MFGIRGRPGMPSLMKRREFFMLLSTAISPLTSTAFVKRSLAATPTIGVLAVGSPSPEEFIASFQKGLHDRGYIEGQNIQFDVQSGEGHADRLPELAAELVRRKVAIIIGFQTPTVTAAMQATTEIPIVMDRARQNTLLRARRHRHLTIRIATKTPGLAFACRSSRQGRLAGRALPGSIGRT